MIPFLPEEEISLRPMAKYLRLLRVLSSGLSSSRCLKPQSQQNSLVPPLSEQGVWTGLLHSSLGCEVSSQPCSLSVQRLLDVSFQLPLCRGAEGSKVNWK